MLAVGIFSLYFYSSQNNGEASIPPINTAKVDKRKAIPKDLLNKILDFPFISKEINLITIPTTTV
jgi:hypothetical protein